MLEEIQIWIHYPGGYSISIFCGFYILGVSRRRIILFSAAISDEFTVWPRGVIYAAYCRYRVNVDPAQCLFFFISEGNCSGSDWRFLRAVFENKLMHRLTVNHRHGPAELWLRFIPATNRKFQRQTLVLSYAALQWRWGSLWSSSALCSTASGQSPVMEIVKNGFQRATSSVKYVGDEYHQFTGLIKRKIQASHLFLLLATIFDECLGCDHSFMAIL